MRLPFSFWLSLSLVTSPVAAQTLTADILVEADRIVREIPRTLYGSNIEWVHNGWGLWDVWGGRPLPKIVKLGEDLRPALLRFPGGTFSDFYHWRDGVGPAWSRPATPILDEGERSGHGFGTDEALTFSDRIGAELFVTVNLGTGTPEEAADWVRHVNRGRTRVRFWELGNELYSKSTSPAAARVSLAPEAYAERFLAFAAAMRAVDPNIRLAAIGGESSGPFPLVEYPNWNRIVLERAGHQIDFLAVHNAYAPVMVLDRGEDLATVYRAMLAAPMAIQESLNRMTSDIEQWAPPGARERIRIAVTEWGPYFHYHPHSRFVDHVKTLASALFVASTMKVFLESPRVDVAISFKLLDNSFMGWIGMRNGDFQETAPYYSLQLFSRHFGERLVAASTLSPGAGTAAVGMVPAVEKSPYLEAVASLRSDGSKLFLIVINRHFSEPIRGTIRLHGFQPASSGTVRTLNGTGIDAHTGTQLPFPEWIPWARQAVAPHNPRFDVGQPREVWLAETVTGPLSPAFEHSFPAHSLTAFEIPITRR